MRITSALAVAALACGSTSVVIISEINGNKFLSPYQGQKVSSVTGLVTAKGPSGIWIRSTTLDTDVRTSESIYVFSSTIGRNLTIGDVIKINATVTEYRSTNTYVYLTELSSPAVVGVVSTGNTVTPLVIGVDTLSPPTKAFSSLDNGDVYNIPNNVSQLSTANPILAPRLYGMDFWESLTGELVTVKGARAVTKPNAYGDTWVIGEWKVTGLNSRGGLTMTDKGKDFVNIRACAVLTSLQTPIQKPSSSAHPWICQTTLQQRNSATVLRISPELSLMLMDTMPSYH